MADAAFLSRDPWDASGFDKTSERIKMNKKGLFIFNIEFFARLSELNSRILI